jgi:hypothetical protein
VIGGSILLKHPAISLVNDLNKTDQQETMGKNQFRSPKIAFALREQTARANFKRQLSAVLLQFGEARSSTAAAASRPLAAQQ